MECSQRRVAMLESRERATDGEALFLEPTSTKDTRPPLARADVGRDRTVGCECIELSYSAGLHQFPCNADLQRIEHTSMLSSIFDAHTQRIEISSRYIISSEHSAERRVQTEKILLFVPAIVSSHEARKNIHDFGKRRAVWRPLRTAPTRAGMHLSCPNRPTTPLLFRPP
ncbi:hypothetical protein CPB85DRAFT_267124 [Mucidula mucida]|nr:hypothetical protein CPB85DRAFT_267124 [Mucidula mucida]